MGKAIVLIFILIFFLIKAFIKCVEKKNYTYLLISFFLVVTPLELSKTLIFSDKSIAGTLGGAISFNVPIILSLALVPLVKWKNFKVNIDFISWKTCIFSILIISLINPYNSFPFATLVFAVVLASYLFFFVLLYQLFNREEIIKGTWDGLFTLCLGNFLLALCFPLLNMSFVTSIIHESGTIWSTRLDTRSGAIGLFGHPGALALYTLISSSFFLSSYLNKYKRRISFYILLANSVTIILTHSRTSYLCFVIVLLSVYFIHRNASKSIFSIPNVLKFIIPLGTILGWLVLFSPLSQNFLESDADSQIDNRLIHSLMAITIFFDSPLIGVGINSHLAYVENNLFIPTNGIEDFFLENPIHNIHLIILTELGLLGLLGWFFFLFYNIMKSKKEISDNKNLIFSSSFIGVLIIYITYGMTGWAPFSIGILPYFLFFSFFSIKFRNKIVVPLST